MGEITLKSYHFRREREARWREFEALVTKSSRSGTGSLSTAEMVRLPRLYRAVLSSLSVARSISLDRNLLDYLENLAARGYYCVYGARGTLRETLKEFLVAGFPRAVRRARWAVAAAGVTLALGFLAGFHLTVNDPAWFHSFVPDGLADGRTPMTSTEELRRVLYDDADADGGLLTAFASFVFTHNATGGMLSFALGFAFGVPVLLLMFANGAVIGSFAALYASRGLGADISAWLLIHGSTELTAVALSGGAGLVVGAALAFPGRHTRLQSLAQNGRWAVRIVVGAIGMFLVAGLLEAFTRQLITDMTARFVIAAVMFVLWLAYFVLAGAARDGG